jgi:SAM-dependent methyltransferase
MNITKAMEIDGWMSEAELTWIAETAASSKIVVEIGSWQGRSTRAWADNLLDGGVVYCIDTWDGSPEIEHLIADKPKDWVLDEFHKNLGDHIRSKRVIPIRTTSIEGYWKIPYRLNADVVFLDGDHHYPVVSEEIRLYRQVVKPGGLISGHDFGMFNFAGVTAAAMDAFIGVIPGPYVIHREGESIWWVKL